MLISIPEEDEADWTVLPVCVASEKVLTYIALFRSLRYVSSVEKANDGSVTAWNMAMAAMTSENVVRMLK